MTEVAVLLADPVFQLNTFLWSLEDLADVGEVHPVLRNAGYYLSAIGRRLIVPVDPQVLDVLADIIGSKDRSPTHPDLWLRHQSDEAHPVIELKAHGFSPESSNKVQAVKMLVSAADLEHSLGGGGPRAGHLIYATVESDAEALADTLRILKDQVESAGAAAAPTATIEFGWNGQAITMGSPDPAELPGPMHEPLATPAAVIEVPDPANDAQPLYLVPWVPGLDDSQDAELRADGLRQLTARLLTHTIAAVGQVKVPGSVTLSGSELLDSATFGVFGRWRDADRPQFALAAARLIERALRATGSARIEHDRVEVDLPTVESQDRAIERLERADPSDPTKSIATVLDEPPTLFDEATTIATGSTEPSD